MTKIVPSDPSWRLMTRSFRSLTVAIDMRPIGRPDLGRPAKRMNHASSGGVFTLVMVVLAALRDRAPLGIRSTLWIRRLSRVAAAEHVRCDPFLQLLHV